MKALKTQQETLTFPLTERGKKKKGNLDRGPVPRISPEISARNMGCVWWKLWAEPRDHSPLWTTVTAWPSKYLLSKLLLFHLHVNCFPALWRNKPLPPTSSFVFSCRGYLRWGFQPFWQVTQFSWVSVCTCVIKLLCAFSFLNLSHVNSILRPVRRT